MYCDYRDQAQQTPVNLIGDLLKQLVGTLPTLPEEIIRLYEEKSRKSESLELVDVEAILPQICQTFDQTYICIDALDECEDRSSHFLKSLQKLSSTIRLFITGRPHILATVNQHFVDPLTIPIEANENDIKMFITEKIDEDHTRDPDLMDQKLKQVILEKIGATSKGMLVANT